MYLHVLGRVKTHMFGGVDAVLWADGVEPAVRQGGLQVRHVGGEGGGADEGGGVLPALVLVVGAVQQQRGSPHLTHHLQALPAGDNDEI